MISRRWSEKEWGLGKKFRFGVIKVEEFAGLACEDRKASGEAERVKNFSGQRE